MPHHREEIHWRSNPFARPAVALEGQGPQWILEANDGSRWRVYHIRYVDGKAKRTTPELATHRVFESKSGELRRRELGKGERRDMEASLVDRQLKLAIPIVRATAPDPASKPKGWAKMNDGWDAYREHHGWGPSRHE